MAPTYHSIAYAGFDVANPVSLEAILDLAARTGLPAGARVLDIGPGSPTGSRWWPRARPRRSRASPPPT
jgi:hypothetical protein